MRSLIVAVSLALLVGCYDPKTDQLVVLAGDSIMRDAVPHLLDEIHPYDNKPHVMIEAAGGAPLREIQYIQGRIESINSIKVPDMVFVSLGANDRIFPAWSFGFLVHAFMADIHPDTRVYWIPPHSRMPGSDPFIQAVERAAYSWPNLEVLRLHPSAGDVSADGVHLSEAGNVKLANKIKEVIYDR